MDVRRRPIVALSPDDVRARVAACFPGRAAEDVALLAGGACNTSYAFRVGADRFVLRLHVRDPGAGARERSVLALASDRVPVPEVLHVGEGFSILRFLPGLPLARGLTPPAVRAAARALAALGQVEFPRPGRIEADGQAHPWPFDGGRGFVEECLASPRAMQALGQGPMGTDGVRHLLARDASRFAEMDAEARLVHGDFNPGNVLLEDGRVTGILDWEFAHAGSPWMDVGNLLRHLPEGSAEHEAAVAAGLSEGGTALPPDWRRRAALIDLSSHLEFLASEDDLGEAFRARCVARVRALLAS